MFKALVLRRNFSLFNRVPYSRMVRSAARDGHESVTIQRFRIRKPFFRKSRLVGAVAIVGATYAFTRYMGIEFKIEEIEEEEQKPTRSSGHGGSEDESNEPGQEVDEEEEDDEEEDNDALLFFPTGFSRPTPKTFYKGSDPEWQEFRKLAANRPRMEEIRGQLVTTFREAVAKDPQIVARVGQVDTKKGKVWIEVKFPDGPPIEYERPGIELTEDLEWRKATRPVEYLHHHRLNNILFPTAAASALYQDTKRKAELSWKDFRVYMGWEQKSEPDTLTQFVQRIGANPPSTPNPTIPATSATPNPPPTSPAKDTQQSATSPSVTPVDAPANDVRIVLPDPKKLTLDLSQFRLDFRKAFKPYRMEPTRGAFLVMGFIEVYGDRARVTFQIVAAYDPKQGKYVQLQASVWNAINHRQRPKGGP